MCSNDFLCAVIFTAGTLRGIGSMSGARTGNYFIMLFLEVLKIGWALRLYMRLYGSSLRDYNYRYI